eukprot:scaffold626_cov409-Prasinococcus_capsulatus_cf.AAC.28
MNRAVVQLTRANASTGAKTRNCAGPIPPATLGVRQDGISKKCTALRLSLSAFGAQHTNGATPELTTICNLGGH